jgi:hypothetical protein
MPLIRLPSNIRAQGLGRSPLSGKLRVFVPIPRQLFQQISLRNVSLPTGGSHV